MCISNLSWIDLKQIQFAADELYALISDFIFRITYGGVRESRVGAPAG